MTTAPPLLIGIVVSVVVAGCAAGVVPSPGTIDATQPATQAADGMVTTTATHAAPAPPPSAPPSDVPSRVVARELGIDLPVISGDVVHAGNPPDYPLCDVAQFLTTFPYPGRLRATTWIYGHARDGMFLPLLRASERADGAELIGQTIDVFSTANIRYRYRISTVLRHATDRSAAQGVPPDQGRLIIQTSEGPRGTIPKLQVIASLTATESASPEDAQPPASPRACANE